MRAVTKAFMTLAFFASVAAVNATAAQAAAANVMAPNVLDCREQVRSQGLPKAERKRFMRSCIAPLRKECRQRLQSEHHGRNERRDFMRSCIGAPPKRRGRAMVVADGNSSDCAARRCGSAATGAPHLRTKKGRSCAPPFADYQRQRRYPQPP